MEYFVCNFVALIERHERMIEVRICCQWICSGCSSSCIGSGAYIDKGKSVSYGNGHQRQKCKPWEWTKTKVQAMGMGKRQRLRKEINQEEDGIGKCLLKSFGSVR
jgi:hypothetical protein